VKFFWFALLIVGKLTEILTISLGYDTFVSLLTLISKLSFLILAAVFGGELN